MGDSAIALENDTEIKYSIGVSNVDILWLPAILAHFSEIETITQSTVLVPKWTIPCHSQNISSDCPSCFIYSTVDTEIFFTHYAVLREMK